MAKKGTITAWLRKRISHLDYGYKHYGKVKHCNYNDEVLDHLRNKVYLSHLTNRNLANHFSGEDTFYFAGNSWGPETLVMIDIDCHHGIGSLNGALAYAQFLKDTFFPDLYFEPSTNGVGVHGYFVVKKDGMKPEIVNDLLGQLQAYLRQTIYELRHRDRGNQRPLSRDRLGQQAGRGCQLQGGHFSKDSPQCRSL